MDGGRTTKDERFRVKEVEVPFKFEKLEVWRLALEYIDLIYEIGNELPRSEEYNLKSQMPAIVTLQLRPFQRPTGGRTR